MRSRSGIPSSSTCRQSGPERPSFPGFLTFWRWNWVTGWASRCRIRRPQTQTLHHLRRFVAQAPSKSTLEAYWIPKLPSRFPAIGLAMKGRCQRSRPHCSCLETQNTELGEIPGSNQVNQPATGLVKPRPACCCGRCVLKPLFFVSSFLLSGLAVVPLLHCTGYKSSSNKKKQRSRSPRKRRQLHLPCRPPVTLALTASYNATHFTQPNQSSITLSSCHVISYHAEVKVHFPYTMLFSSCHAPSRKGVNQSDITMLILHPVQDIA
ncbi:hypothetical protein B0T20DRAFT_178582 [Sordaria brevicollis]|uniref:Uncharacterized protein n=1 Tax=Sordaria brevicollis TaxID=83679 RepID=A0AAE0PI20_SORBR|nr:hypothetical protein B0T20DRAFT_178582 [Sordaria brevicollis]